MKAIFSRRSLPWIAVLVALCLLGIGGYRLRQARRAQAAGNLPTAPVRRGDFAEIVRCRGEIGAERSVQLSAPLNIPDLKIVWMAEPGTMVKKDQVVIRFDQSGAQRQLDENTAALLQAQATLDQAVAQARITAEQDKLDLANARYELERARLEASKQAIVSVLQGESSKIDLASAEAKLRVQLATVELHKKSDEAKIASLTRQRDKAQSDVNLTKSRIAQMNLAAPLNGMVAYKMNRANGWMNQQPFKVGDGVWPGAVIAEIPDPGTLRMEGKLEEVERGRVAVGNEVRIRVDSFPEQVFQGKLQSISALTEMSWEWPPVRSFLALAPIDNLDPRLRTSMNGSLDVIIRHILDALSVPSKALFTRNGKPVVYVADDKGYRPVVVEVVARNPDEVALKGISPGASVSLAEPEEVKEVKRP